MWNISSLPMKYRRIIYALLFCAGLVLGSMSVWYGSADPVWLSKSLKVLAYVASGVGGMAAIHTGDAPTVSEASVSASNVVVQASAQEDTPKPSETPSSPSTVSSTATPQSDINPNIDAPLDYTATPEGSMPSDTPDPSLDGDGASEVIGTPASQAEYTGNAGI